MSWKNIVGHEAPIRLLKGQVASGRLAHAYLFVGLKGIGKSTLATELAKALVCERRQGDFSSEPAFAEPTPSDLSPSEPIPSGPASFSPASSEPAPFRPRPSEPTPLDPPGAGQAEGACDACSPCRKITQGTYPDLIRMKPETETGNIGIDQVRCLIEWMALTPYSAGWKVGIVEEAESLTEQAAHACLKLLEEPPDKSVLILITSSAYRLPATVSSRCHWVRLTPQGIDRVTRHLEEKEGLAPGQAQRLAALSGGRLGLALQIHRENRLSTKNAVLDQLLWARRQGILEVAVGSAPRPEVEEALDWLAAWWRDLAVLSVGGDSSWVIHQDRLEDLRRQLSAHPLSGDHRGSLAVGPLRPLAVEEWLDRVERAYWALGAVQKNASCRMALAYLLSR